MAFRASSLTRMAARMRVLRNPNHSGTHSDERSHELGRNVRYRSQQRHGARHAHGHPAPRLETKAARPDATSSPPQREQCAQPKRGRHIRLATTSESPTAIDLRNRRSPADGAAGPRGAHCARPDRPTRLASDTNVNCRTRAGRHDTATFGRGRAAHDAGQGIHREATRLGDAASF